MNVDAIHANYYLGALFHAVIILFFDGFPELSLTVGRLAVFYKQRDLYFYPAWAYAIPATILKVPISLFSALIWTSLTYYVIGYSPEAGSASMPTWLKWGFWVSLLTYGEVGLALNEFLAPRWQKCRVVLPFEPLTLMFQNVRHYADTAAKGGSLRKKLCDITGAFRPGVLTGLMGVSGAGKTTLMDVLAGRKTSGTIEGDIRIGGFPKVQETFLGFRVTEFVKEVLEIIEFDEIKDCLVGMPGVSGLSTEQRKCLTIDLEHVANPSIIFMDEPTTGLDARAAAIVMRAVKNVAETGRTIVCTIHQPSIDIFEAFGEAISGVQKIRNNYNPATWMLEITSRSAEAQLYVDFTQVYKNCVLYQNNKEHVNRWSTPPPGSKELYFASRFSPNGWGQFKSCLWKQHLSYWRSPSYNLLRFTYMLIASLFFGILFWDQGRKINSQQGVFNALVLPYVATERSRCMVRGLMHLLSVMVEVPYLLVQAIAFVIITYSMIGYYWSACKVFCGRNFTVSLLHNVKPVLWISDSSTGHHRWMKITESGWRKLICSKKSSENLLLRMANSQVVDMDVLSNSEPCTLNGLNHRRGLCAGPIKI
ncbi:unnamed protein product [Camellia sinensis]